MQEDIENAERDIASFEAQRAQVAESIRALQAEEDLAKGVFRHKEIHDAKQEKLRLDFEIQYRRAKINRLRFGS